MPPLVHTLINIKIIIFTIMPPVYEQTPIVCRGNKGSEPSFLKTEAMPLLLPSGIWQGPRKSDQRE